MSAVRYKYAYRYEDGDWREFASEYPPNKQNARAIAEEALEKYATENVDYDVNDSKIEVAIRCHSYSFWCAVENNPVFSASPIPRNLKAKVTK